MEFTIVGRDQGSQVITAINKKISEFGKDVGKSIVGFLGPMALATMAISKITEHLENMKRKAQEAFDFGAGIADSAQKMGVTAEEFQKITRAAESTGESVDKVAQSFKLARDLIEAAKGGSADAAKSLEAMGITSEMLKDAKPEDVLKKIAEALASTEDPAKRAEIAIGALGKTAKDLQDTLAKGFDIAGAFESRGDLSDAEVEELKRTQNEIKRKETRDKLESARAQAAKLRVNRLLEEETKIETGASPASSASKELREFQDRRAAMFAQKGGERLSMDELQQIAADMFKERVPPTSSTPPSVPVTPNAVSGAALAQLAKAEEKKAKEPEARASREPKGSKIGGVSNAELGSISVKAPPLTVSSLREIGGGMAGEKAFAQLDLAQVQVNLQERMLQELERINSGSVDFTKPPAGLGLTPGRMIA